MFIPKRQIAFSGNMMLIKNVIEVESVYAPYLRAIVVNFIHPPPLKHQRRSGSQISTLAFKLLMKQLIT